MNEQQTETSRRVFIHLALYSTAGLCVGSLTVLGGTDRDEPPTTVEDLTRYDWGFLVDTTRCIGCGYCVQACPYGCRYIDHSLGRADKCTMCYHRLHRGLDPACVMVCPREARICGNLKDPKSRIRRALRSTAKSRPSEICSASERATRYTSASRPVPCPLPEMMSGVRASSISTESASSTIP